MSQNLQGQFLVALRHLKDPNFFQTVVLLLEHDDSSAMGLVVNSPDSQGVAEALSLVTGKEDQSGGPIYSGGPVEPSALFILHNCDELDPDDKEVTPGVFLTGSSDSFESLIDRVMTSEQDCGFRIFRGYAGWGADQLEGEISRGDWGIIPADAGLVFDEDPYSVWERCFRQVQIQNRFLPLESPDPEWN